MSDIFEKIPSAQDVQKGTNQKIQEAINSFVSRAIKSLESLNERSVTIQAEGSDSMLLHGIHGDKVRAAFQNKWWELKYTSDQRDGDFITISMKSSDDNLPHWQR